MKTDKRKKGSLLSVITRNYLGFSFTILVLFLGFSWFVNQEMERKFHIPSSENLQKYRHYLIEEEYEKFPVEKFLGKKGAFSVLNGEGKMIYSSDEQMPKSFTKDELFVISEIGEKEKTEVTVYTDADGKEKILITKTEHTGETVQKVEKYLLLDSEYHILVDHMGMEKDKLSEKELQYMTDMGKEDVGYWKWEFLKDTGEKNTVVFRCQKNDWKKYTRLTRSAKMLWFFVIPIFGFVFFIFTVSLSYRVKKPLLALRISMNRFRQGQILSNENEGPDEFVEIGDDFVRLAQKLADSEKSRKKADEDKQKMLADISHDLKTPITVLQGYAKAICDGVIPVENREQYLKIIYNKATELNELINTFYEYSKLEHPDFRPIKEKQDICEYVREYLASKYNEITLSGFSLDVQIPEKEIFCEIDRRQFRRVFDNILNNSIKHNKKETTLFFFVVQEGNTVCIKIGDDGMGIPKELSGAIFEPFVVGDESRNSKQGTGLGLAIAKKIVESHSGFIELTRTPDPGFSSEFLIWLRISEPFSQTDIVQRENK
ncbi:MAG: sensor histidine kinase [Blautia sp.]